MLGFGIIIPVLPFYSRELGATSFHLGLLMATYSVMQLIFAPIWGGLSDKNGRKPFIMLGVIGFAISFFIFAMANSLWVLFFARTLGGFLSSAAMPTVMAYISDTTTDEERSKGMGLMGAAMGIGVIFGPAIGGFLASYGPKTPFFVAALISIINSVFIFLMLPESLCKENRNRQVKIKRPSLRQGLTSPIKSFLLLCFVVSFATANLESTFVYFANDTFGFAQREMGIAFMTMGIVSVVVQGGLVSRLINSFGEETVIRAGLLITGSAYFLIIMAIDLTTLIFYLSLSGVGMGILRPSLTTLISKRTVFEQGVSMGMISSFDSLGRIIGPIFGGATYLLGHNYPYITGAIIMFMLFFALSVQNIIEKKRQREA